MTQAQPDNLKLVPLCGDFGIEALGLDISQTFWLSPQRTTADCCYRKISTMASPGEASQWSTRLPNHAPRCLPGCCAHRIQPQIRNRISLSLRSLK